MLNKYSKVALFVANTIALLVWMLGPQELQEPLSAYIILCLLALPLFISKIVFRRSFLSLASIASFLIYFLVYICIYLGVQFTKVDIGAIYSAIGLLFLVLWTVLLGIWLFRVEDKQFNKVLSLLFIAFLAIVPFLVANYVSREYGALISTDLLVHKTVTNGMSELENFGIMPSTYSNTFTDEGYPILFFHSLMLFLEQSLQLDFDLLIYYLDYAFTALSAIILTKLFSKQFRKKSYVWVGVALSLLVFENLAYTNLFFIPQTLAFLFFLMILSRNSRLGPLELTVALLLLIATHFFIGTYLGVILVGFYLLKKYFYSAQWQKLALIGAFAVTVIIVLLSYAGFSVEITFQSGTVDWVGQPSNPDFPGKLTEVFGLIRYGWLILIPAIIVYLASKKKTHITFALIYLLVAFSVYFLSPTFAGKFFLGFAIFSSYLIVSMFQRLKLNSFVVTLIGLVLVGAYGINFYVNFTRISVFLEQTNGYRSAITYKDEELWSFWAKNKPSCTVISDPQTQLLIHSLGEGSTVRGLYLPLEIRNRLINAINNPSTDTLEKLKSAKEEEGVDSGGKVCLILTSRLNEMVENDHLWNELIFTYQNDHQKRLDEYDIPLRSFLYKNAGILYTDKYNQVFYL